MMLANLPPANATLILTTLLSSGFFNGAITPEKVLDRLLEIYRSRDDVLMISRKTDQAVEAVELFFNNSIDCFEDITQRAPRATLLSAVYVVDGIRAECFNTERLIPQSLQCQNEDLSGLNFGFMMSLGFFFLFVTMFTRQRQKACLSCCSGYPGPVIPLNMLDSYEHRRGFALAFGLVATLCLNVLLSNYERLYGIDANLEIRNWPTYTQIFVKIVSAIFISIVAYPFFVCQNMKNRILGSLIGIVYCLMWIGLEAYRAYEFMRTCFKLWAFVWYGEVVGVLLSLADYPLYICLLALFFKFLYTLLKTIKRRQQRRDQGEKMVHWMFVNDSDWKTEYMYLHVKNLFKVVPKKETTEEEDNDGDDERMGKTATIRSQITTKVKKSLYKYKPEFKYSTRMMASVFVTYIGLYQVTIFFAMYGHVMFLLLDLLLDLDLLHRGVEYFGLDMKTFTKWTTAVSKSWWLGLVTALTFSILVLTNSMSWYRKHMMMLRKGNYTFLPRPLQKKKFNSASLMVASMKFAGFQVAYASWGFLTLAFLLFIVYFVFITQIVFPIRDGELSILLYILYTIWPTIVIAICIYVAQYFLSIKVFLFDKMTLQVDNRLTYHIISYFMFYFNIFLGVASCILRIVYGILFGIVFLQRLQKSTLPRNAELIDPGYTSYLGYILLEHQHANPVIQCFTKLLMECVRKEFSKEIHGERQHCFEKTRRGLMPAGFLDTTDMADIKQAIRRKKRIVIRWHLYVMMSLNPTLLKYRFKNGQKRRYHLDLINQLNPALYWPEFNKEEESDTEEEVIRHILDNDKTFGKPRFSIRCKETGQMFEVVYALKSMTESNNSCVKKSKWDKVAENQNGVTDDAITSGVYQIAEEDEKRINGNNEESENIESLKYRKLSTSLFIKGDIEVPNIQKGQSDETLSEAAAINQSSQPGNKLGSSVFIDLENGNDGDDVQPNIEKNQNQNIIRKAFLINQSCPTGDRVESSAFNNTKPGNEGDKEFSNKIQLKQSNSNLTNEEFEIEQSSHQPREDKFSTTVCIDTEVGNYGDNKVCNIQKSQGDEIRSDSVVINQSSHLRDKLDSPVFIEMRDGNHGDNTRPNFQKNQSDNLSKETVEINQSNQTDDELCSSVFINTKAGNYGDINDNNLSKESVEISETEDDANDRKDTAYFYNKEILDNGDKNGILNSTLIQGSEYAKSGDRNEMLMTNDGDKLGLLVGDDIFSSNNTSGRNSMDVELGFRNLACADDDGG